MNDKNSGSSANGSTSGGHKQPAPSTCAGTGVKSKYAMVKEGWGTRTNFQYSYGLDMTPEGIEEGNKILECFREADMEAEKRQK